MLLLLVVYGCPILRSPRSWELGTDDGLGLWDGERPGYRLVPAGSYPALPRPAVPAPLASRPINNPLVAETETTIVSGAFLLLMAK